jgi:hypothetical protein
MNEKKMAIVEFNAKYCSFVYTGPFSAGGWFRTIATANRDCVERLANILMTHNPAVSMLVYKKFFFKSPKL